MSQKNTFIGIFVVFILALIFSEGEPKEYAHWGYEDDIGPKHWAELDERYKMCEEGSNQSPINIVNSIDANLPEIILQGQAKAKEFINDGHTLQVDFNSGNYLNLNDRKYGLKQIHFHTPSENQINGYSYPMEAHLVHSDAYGNLVVVAVMFEESDEDNITLNKLLRNIPEDEDDKEAIKSDIFGYELLPETKSYYTYNGSLTTPPCTEGVRWIVMKNPINASKSQLEDFKAVMEKNNRPIQKQNSRYILH